jgi:phosphoribosylanthranilate isomerase
MSTWVKICGMKRVEDALFAAENGANAIGLLVGQIHTSSDFIDPEVAHSIAEALPPSCASVMVTHLTDVARIKELLHIIQPTSIQLHGDSSIEDITQIRIAFPSLHVIKSIHVTDTSAISEAKKFAPFVDALLLDSVNTESGQIGGTGKTHDWQTSKKIVESVDCNVILAGGLNPQNVAEAIRTVAPFGVDVNSGVKAPNGFKDPIKVAAYIKQAKGLN